MTPLSYVQENHYWAACNGSQDLHKERTACRYYQAGNCRRGSNCPFAHVSIAAHGESPTMLHPMYSGENMCTYYPLAQNPVYLPLSSPAQPVFLWQPYPPLSSSHDPRYGLACQTDNLPDYPDDESDPSSVESSCTATSMDRRLRTALDTAWPEPLEYLGTVRSVASLPGDVVGSNARYPSYSYPIFPGAQTEGVVSGADRATSGPCLGRGSMVSPTSPFSPTWQDDSKKKVFAYKTKPCKFYSANGQCTSGEKCTFIHDPEPRGNAKKSSPTLMLPTEAQLPPKPIDKYDESRARDFYPVTWRVIGGGVMMGGKRRVCPAFAAGQCKLGDDCKLAHETELETNDIGHIEPKSELRPPSSTSTVTPPQQGAKGTTPKRGRAGAPRGRSKVTSTETSQPVFSLATPRPQRPPLPAAEGAEAARKKSEQISSAPASPVHRRTRSMTTVASPPPVNTHCTSYAAEL